jgi:ADP-heptose:LPS heptosyltransferase
MGKPVVGLFGPTDPNRTGPMGEGHEIIFHQQKCWRPCIHPMIPKSCDRRCMEAITVEEVLAAAERIIARLSEGDEPGGNGAFHRPR